MSNHLQVVEQKQPIKQQQPGMIMPAGTIEQALEAFNQYQQLKERLGSKEDFQQIGDRKHPKKSFVRKVQRFFNVSCEIIQDEPLTDPKTGKIIAWVAKARAIHLATGAFQEADGSCGFEEKAEKQRTIHNIRAHAITRAKNRAILDLVGFGEVSAEELNERETYQQAKPKRNGSQSKSDEQEQVQRGRKKVRELMEEKNLTDEQLKKIIKHQTKEKKDDLNKLDVLELRDLVLLMQQMSRTELLNLIGEADAEVIDTDSDGGGRP